MLWLFVLEVSAGTLPILAMHVSSIRYCRWSAVDAQQLGQVQMILAFLPCCCKVSPHHNVN